MPWRRISLVLLSFALFYFTTFFFFSKCVGAFQRDVLPRNALCKDPCYMIPLKISIINLIRADIIRHIVFISDCLFARS